jgi:hypothetical protein
LTSQACGWVSFVTSCSCADRHDIADILLLVTSKINNHERNNQYKKLFPNFSLFLFAMLILNLHKFQEWKNIQIALGKLGKEAIKRKIQELKVDEIPVDVALGARDLIRDFTLDQVRMVR